MQKSKIWKKKFSDQIILFSFFFIGTKNILNDNLNINNIANSDNYVYLMLHKIKVYKAKLIVMIILFFWNK